MAKFIVTSERPEELSEGTYVIDKPSFVEEIKLHMSKAPKNGLTGNFHLRMILDSIAQKYDPQEMTSYSVRVNNFEGRPFSSNEELNNIVVEMLQADYPKIFSKYLDTKIKTRPKNTNTIIYIDSKIKNQYEIFYQNGLAEVEPEKQEKAKSNKIVGKPAVTKEQAEALKKESDN